MKKRERRPSVRKKETMAFFDWKARRRFCSLGALLLREGYSTCETAEERALEQCREEVSAVKQVLAPKRGPGRPAMKCTLNEENERQEENELQEEEVNEWLTEWQEVIIERQEENERPSVNRQESKEIFVPKRARGHPAMKRTQEEDEWRTKAKELEEKCSKVMKQLEEFRGAPLDNLPLLAPCKCHFFKSANTEGQSTYDDYIARHSVQAFLRNVRLVRRLQLQSVGESHDEAQEDLAMVTDFVIELGCQTNLMHSRGRYAEAYVHHAVDFIKDTIPLLREGNEEKLVVVDNLVSKLMSDLVGKLLNFTADLNSTTDRNSTPDQDSAEDDFDDRWRILVVMLRLAEYAFIGHRMLIILSQQIAMVLERLQCMDPFDEGFSQIYENLFFMFHLVETLVAAHMTSWKEENNVGQDILEEWVTCHFHCKTTLERRPTTWTPQFMIVLDSITEKLLEQLHCTAELEGHNGQDIWQKALVHLLASAGSAVSGI